MFRKGTVLLWRSNFDSVWCQWIGYSRNQLSWQPRPKDNQGTRGRGDKVIWVASQGQGKKECAKNVSSVFYFPLISPNCSRGSLRDQGRRGMGGDEGQTEETGTRIARPSKGALGRYVWKREIKGCLRWCQTGLRSAGSPSNVGTQSPY